MKKKISLIFIFVILTVLTWNNNTISASWKKDPSHPAHVYLQITDPIQQLYFQTQARPDGEEMVYHIKGYVYAYLRGESGTSGPSSFIPKHGRKLFGIEGYNIRRAIRDPNNPNDIVIATREILFYLDPNTGQVLEEWVNPYTGKTNTVIPIANDHVNFRYRVEDGVLKSVIEISTCTPPGPPVISSPFPPVPVGDPIEIGDSYLWSSDIFPRYSLNARYCISDGLGLRNNYYTSSEIFDFYVPMRELQKRTWLGLGKHVVPKRVPTVKNSWVRNGPWIPWMCMKETDYDGVLVYHASSELLESWKDLPEWIKERVQKDYPLYMNAPDTIDPTPNATSWTSFYYNVLQPQGVTWAEWCSAH